MNEQRIHDYICNELSLDDQTIALDFVEFLEKNNMEFIKDMGYWKDKIYYIVKYNGECVCFIAIKDPDEKDNRWTIWSDDMGSDCLREDSKDKLILEMGFKHIDFCGNCGSCDGGRYKAIFGKEFDNVCGCTFRIDNPDLDDLLFMKKIVQIRKKEILAD